MHLFPYMSERLRRRIEELDPDGPDAVTARVGRELGALPLHADGTFLWALRPDGVLLRVDTREPRRPPEPETAHTRVRRAVIRGAERYRELEVLVGAVSITPTSIPGYRAAGGASPDAVRRAVAERRVLLVRESARVMGSGDVWFVIAGPDDLDQRGALKEAGIIVDRPVTDRDLRRWNENPWESGGEFWSAGKIDRRDVEPRSLTPEGRARFKRVYARFAVEVLDLMPYETAARAGTLAELLRAYAHGGGPDLWRRVADEARATGFGPLVFDPDGMWERDGWPLPIVTGQLWEGVPRALAAHVRAACGSDTWPRADEAAAWLRETVFEWSDDAMSRIAGGEEPLVPAFDDDEVPEPIREHRVPSRPEQGWPLEDLVAGLDAAETDALRRFCVGPTLAARLRAAAAGSGDVARLLDIAEAWAAAPDPETAARAGALAEEAARLAGDALFAAPFRLMTVQEPAEIVALALEAARGAEVARFRSLARDHAVWEGSERRVGEQAVVALTEALRRFVLHDPSADAIARGEAAWAYEPARPASAPGESPGAAPEPDAPARDAGTFALPPEGERWRPRRRGEAEQPDAEPEAPRHLRCGICSELGDYEHAVQTVGGDPSDTVLPEVAGDLEVERDIRSGHPGLSLKRCPDCGTFYLYRSIYEFNYGGSWDEYTLTRLADDVAVDYLEGRRSDPP